MARRFLSLWCQLFITHISLFCASLSPSDFAMMCNPDLITYGWVTKPGYNQADHYRVVRV